MASEYEEGYEEGKEEGHAKGIRDAEGEELAYLSDLADLEDSLREKLVQPSFVLDLKDMLGRLGYLFMSRDVGI